MLAAVCSVSLATATPCQILPISGGKTYLQFGKTGSRKWKALDAGLLKG